MVATATHNLFVLQFDQIKFQFSSNIAAWGGDWVFKLLIFFRLLQK
jgi:hypothetical protein